MKKFLAFIFFIISTSLLTGGYLVYDRYRQNPEQIFPYPYILNHKQNPLKIEAPILIIGDQMGQHLAKFKDELAKTISVNLTQNIKIESLAQNGHALHRNLYQLKSLERPWPAIIIFQGASEEFKELKFRPEDTKVIKKNFSLYKDERIETALILWPWPSRLIYWPHQRLELKETPQLLSEISEENYLQRLETELLLFEQQLIQLIHLSRENNSLLILSTTPLNLDISPKRVCEFTSTIEIEKELSELNNLIKANNFKTAYAKSSKLVQQHLANSQLFFAHGQIAKGLGLYDEALTYLLQASAYDCGAWRSNEVYNTMIRKIARNHQVILFDFAKLLQEDWAKQVTFSDELYPQNLYYEKAMHQLGLVIKGILKL